MPTIVDLRPPTNTPRHVTSIVIWMGEPIALELHHVNGVKDDLRIENLQILCPNCHAFTDNYRGRNISK